MDKNKLQLPHTAISTWSGFVYQGKVALYHCLRLILKGNDIISSHTLQLDSIDDFAILDEQNECISMHQVKALKSTSFSTYKPEILKQQEEAKKNPKAKVYFHVSREVLKPEKFSENFAPVCFYKYLVGQGTKDYCMLDEINDLIEDLIKGIYSKYQPESPYKLEVSYLEQCRNFLENIILNKVIRIHHKIQESKDADQREIAFKEKISFNQFIHILDMNIEETLLNDEYFYQVLRKYTGIYYKEYCDDIDEDECDFNKLDAYLSHILALDKDSLKKFICSILPHKKGEFCDLKSFHDETYNRDDLRDGLFYVLDKLSMSDIDNQGLHPSMFYWQNESCYYYPTAIHKNEQHKKRFCSSIFKSSMDNDLNFLYESGNLITVSIDCNSIFDEISVGAKSNYEEDGNYHNRISKFKNIALISVDNAKRIIDA